MEFESDDALLAMLSDIDAYAPLDNSGSERSLRVGVDSAAAFPVALSLAQFAEEEDEVERGVGNENLPHALDELIAVGSVDELTHLLMPAAPPQIAAKERPHVSLPAQQAKLESEQEATGAVGRRSKASMAGKRTITWDPNKARKECKAEIVHLRNAATELEDQLTELKRSKRLGIGSNSCRECATIPCSGQQAADTCTARTQQLRFTIPIRAAGLSYEMCAWQQIAKRRGIARIRSERENTRLKRALEKQLKVALDLERRFRRALVTAKFDTCSIQARTGPVGNYFSCKAEARSTSEVFLDLLAGVEQCYAEVDSVVASSGLAGLVFPSMVAKMRPDCDRRLFLEVCSTKALPFDMHVTASVVWSHYVYTKERISFRHYSYHTPKSTDPAENTAVENFNLSVEIDRKLAKFCVKQITRRYVEATRVVVAWCSTCTPIEFAGDPLSGVCFLERGYVVVTHPSLRPDGLTLVQTCYVVRPLSDGGSLGSDSPHLAAITDFLLSSKERNILASDQMIENELLRRSTGIDGVVAINTTIGGDTLDSPQSPSALMAFALEDGGDVYDAEQHAAALAAALTFVDQFSSASPMFSPGPQLAASPFPSDSELLGGLAPNLLLHDELQGFSADDDELELLALNALSQDDEDGENPSNVQVAFAGQVEQIETVKPTPSSRRKRQQTQTQQQRVPSTTELIKRANGPKKPLKYNPNKARDERKEELIHLRKRVAELETQLHVLQEKRPRIVASAASSPTPTGVDNANQEPEQQLVIAGVWQDMANRQCEERIKSERENLRLKLVLENQIKIAKSLERLLKKKMSSKDVGHCPQCSELHLLYPPTKDRTDEEIYAHLAAGVEQSYLEVDSLFEANGLARIETPYSDAQMRNDSCKGVYLEICANKVLPFELHSTGAAAWRHFSFAIQNTPYRYYSFDAPKNAEATDDTIVENFSLGLHANSTSAHFRVKQILRRYVEEDRVVIVWRSFVEPVEFSDEPLTGLRFREKGYIVIKRPKAIAGDYTLIQHCYIFTPNFNTGDVHGANGSNEQHPKVGAVTDFVLSATAANIAASHQMIENVLLAQALKK